jgi:hypothetical protein
MWAMDNSKALTHISIQSLKTNLIDWKERTIWRSSRDMSRFICDAFTDARLACYQLKNTEDESARAKHATDACTAMRILRFASRLSYFTSGR